MGYARPRPNLFRVVAGFVFAPLVIFIPIAIVSYSRNAHINLSQFLENMPLAGWYFPAWLFGIPLFRYFEKKKWRKFWHYLVGSILFTLIYIILTSIFFTSMVDFNSDDLNQHLRRLRDVLYIVLFSAPIFGLVVAVVTSAFWVIVFAGTKVYLDVKQRDDNERAAE